MPPSPAWPADPWLERALGLGLDAPPTRETAALASLVAGAFGPSTLALVHYGSHGHGAGALPESAHDFFVIVEDYGPAYRSLASGPGVRPSAGAASRLNRILPPNVLSLTAPDPAGARLAEPGIAPPLTAKCAVLSRRDLVRACSSRAPDLFVRARLFQQVQLVWTRDPAARDRVRLALLEVRARAFEWGRAFLPARFDAEGFCRALLAGCYSAEIRPERPERVDALIAAQRGVLLPVYQALLDHLERHGTLAREGGRFRDARPPAAVRRLLARLYLGRSKLRATLRWAKYVALYDGWLDYVVRKVERSRGVEITLAPRERRWPLLFLWPRALRLLGRRPGPRL